MADEKDDLTEAPPQVDAVPVAAADPASASLPETVSAADSPPAAADIPVDAKPEGLAPSLLEEFDDKQKVAAEPEKADDKPAADAPAEEVKAEEPKTEEPKAEETPAEEPKVDAEPEAPAVEEPVKLEPIDYFAEEGGIKLPETVSLTDEKRGEVIAAFDAFRADPVKGAQGLIDLFDKSVKDVVADIHAQQWSTFHETVDGWRAATMADPVLGGAGHDTAMFKVAVARDHLVSSAKPGTPAYEADMAEFHDFMRMTGAGNHRVFLRIMHNASKYVREAPPPPNDGIPPRDLGKKPGRGKISDIYTHPTSNAGS